MEVKKISVIILGNDNIKKCLENLNEQSYIKDMELILLYPQKRIEEIEQLKLEYKNVKFIMSETNIFKILKQKKEEITGDYISILNSEDNVTVDYYRTMISKATLNDADIIMSNAILQYKDEGKAYLNFSESTLRELENEQIIEEYLRQEGLSFLWSIYGNKICIKELFFKAVEEICEINDEIQNYYFFTIIFYYSKKVIVENNEVLFYSFEKNEAKEAIRKLLQNSYDDNDDIYNNAVTNFKYMEEFLNKKGIETKIENWKKLYFDKEYSNKIETFTKVKTAWNDNLNKIKREIIKEDTKVVSFDIFDTLIMRPFWNPADLFAFLNDYFRKIAKIETGIDFSKLRIRAEERVRTLLGISKKKQDMTLDEIYNEIKFETNLDDEIINKMKEKEIELEVRFCNTRTTGKELYELSKYLNKKVIAVSDMYLPKNVIEKILNKNGYEMDNIYISGEIGLTKHIGDLYKAVLDDLKIEPKQVVHIGDNYYADYENSVKKGINGQFLAKAIDVFCDENITNNLGKLFKQNLPIWEDNAIGLSFLGIRCMLGVVANTYFDNPYRTFNNLTDFNADAKLIGYYALGMHLFGISDWLLKETSGKYNKIVFCARDGYWIMQAYKILKQAYKNVPDEKYLYISRRALIPATLQNEFDFYKLAELIDIYKYTPKTILKYIKDILKNTENLEDESKKIGLDINKKFETQSEFNIYIKLIINKFYDKDKHLKIVNALKKYFENIIDENSCIFDIGYSAKPEMYLSKLCDKPIDTYFVNINGGDAFNHAKMGNFKLKTYFDYRPSIIGVVREIFMSTTDPSCIGYKINENDEVEPIFEEREIKYQERFIIDTMQREAIKFIENMVGIFKEDLENLYYQKYYISLPHEMYIQSANELDQEVLRTIDLEDAVGLGDKIDGITEWNREIDTKNQKRSNEFFDAKYTQRLEEKIRDLENEKQKLEGENKQKSEEIENIYNSKRWKCFDNLNKFIGRKK